MWEFLLAGGPFMVVLVLTSIVGLTFIIEAVWLRRSRVVPASTRKFDQTTEQGRPQVLACFASRSALHTGRLVLLRHRAPPWPKTATSIAFVTRAETKSSNSNAAWWCSRLYIGIAPFSARWNRARLIYALCRPGPDRPADNSVSPRASPSPSIRRSWPLIAIPTLVA